ncbi:MAG: ATP-binding protein [Xanthobacteraceae bacterium]
MLGVDTLQNQRQPAAAEPLGHVHGVNGGQVTIGLLNASRNGLAGASVTVGKFVKIQTAQALLVGVITDVSVQTSTLAMGQGYHGTATVDLMGEIAGSPARFRRGVMEYPSIGNPVAALANGEMWTIFDASGANSIKIGQIQQDNTIGVCIDVDEMLNKHFAVLGTTGVGKSSAVAVILQQTLQARPNLRIFLLDVHNEYGRCFGERAQVMNPGNLRLPFWLFNFDEIVDVFFGGRLGTDEEIEILSEVIPLAKVAYTQYRMNAERLALKRLDPKSLGYTVDTPVPYRLQDLLLMIDERMGKLENRSSRMRYHKLITRIETVSNDPRYAFMFENANVGGDTMAEAISQLFRLPAGGKPITVMQIAGFPAEVVDPVVSVLCRMAFDFGLWSDGACPMLFVCEEAHRYASADRTVGFGPTRRAISRIAKEGRKYGVYLGLVTQRPAELDPTIISQCSTLFAMRMSNDRDQALLRSAVSDTAANLFAFVPSLGTREALAFGVGVPLPTRLTFATLPPHLIPRSEAFANERIPSAGVHNLDFISSVVERWRGSTLSLRPGDEPPRETTPAAVVADPAPPPAPAVPEASRFSLLKKPLASQADPFASLRSAPPANPGRTPQY